MTFNTAILYDIENLIGGYSKADMLSSLSLKDIYNEIIKKDIGKIAIQRAYANWSDPRLNILRGDIIELGIEPVQMFGFGRGPQKNASDIQLAIDAIDIAFTRQAIKTFVIVSGDGAFSALAKKLHEYGCLVIGCAFRKTTNRVFKAVCDDFIWIEEPKGERDDKEVVEGASDPILYDYSRKFSSLAFDKDKAFDEAQHILDFLTSNVKAMQLLKENGLNISIISQILAYRLSGFNYISLGFVKFVDFLRYICKNGDIKLVYKPPSEYRLVFRKAHLSGFEEVEPLHDIPEIHTVDFYNNVLSKGAPVLKIPPQEIVYQISNYISGNRIKYQGVSVGDIIDDIGGIFDFEQSDIKSCVLSLVYSGCFAREPEEGKLSEQKLYFLPHNSEQAISILKKAIRDKIEGVLGEVDEEVIARILS